MFYAYKARREIWNVASSKIFITKSSSQNGIILDLLKLDICPKGRICLLFTILCWKMPSKEPTAKDLAFRAVLKWASLYYFSFFFSMTV